MRRTSQRFLSGLLGAVLAAICMFVTKCAMDRASESMSAAERYIERHVTALMRRDGR